MLPLYRPYILNYRIQRVGLPMLCLVNHLSKLDIEYDTQLLFFCADI